MAFPQALLSGGSGGLSVDAGSEAHSKTGDAANGVQFSSKPFSDNAVAMVSVVALVGIWAFVRGFK